jgi:hypothetical protein
MFVVNSADLNITNGRWTDACVTGVLTSVSHMRIDASVEITDFCWQLKTVI